MLTKNFVECGSTELDLWAKEPVDTAIEDGWFVDYSSDTGTQPGSSKIVSIEVPAADHFISLPDCRLKLRVRIVNEDGSPVVDVAGTTSTPAVTHTIAPVNNVLHSLWESIDVSLNHQSVAANDRHYAIKAMVLDELNFSEDSKGTWLRTQGYWEDAYTGQAETLTVGAFTRNTGLGARRTIFAANHGVELEGRLHEAIFNVDRLLVPGVQINIRLTRASDAFSLLSPTANARYRIVIDELKFRVKFLSVRPDITQSIEAKLTTEPAFYPLSHFIETRDLTIEQGVQTKELSNPFQNRIPRRLIMLLLPNTALHGSYNSDPMLWTPQNLETLSVRVDNRTFPMQPMRLDWTNSHYLDSYVGLVQSLGRSYIDFSNGITFTSFAYGRTIHAFDLTASNNNDCYILPRHGELAVKLTFSAATATTLSVIFIGEFSHSLYIHANRYVEIDRS